MHRTTLTFKLINEGPEYEAICKGLGQPDRLTINYTGSERLYDMSGSHDGTPVFRFSEIRVSNAFGFVVQRIQNKAPSMDIDIEIDGAVADKILAHHMRNPDKRYKLVLTRQQGVF